MKPTLGFHQEILHLDCIRKLTLQLYQETKTMVTSGNLHFDCIRKLKMRCRQKTYPVIASGDVICDSIIKFTL